MAIAVPFLIGAAEAAWSAIVFVGSALATAIGIKVAADKIEERFSSDAPSAIQPCAQTTPAAQAPVASQAASAKPWVNNPEAKAEHEAYKVIAKKAPPPGLDPCDELQWKLRREEDVVKGMENWDAKWLPGRHATAIEQRKRGIETLKELIKNTCKDQLR